MPTIDQLNSQDVLSISDLIAIYSCNNGDARKTSLNNLAVFLSSIITVTDSKITQYAAPNATGFVVSTYATSSSIWLLLTPLAGYAAGTIVLPPLANCVDRQEVLVNTTQAVTALTIVGNGASVSGAPTTLAAGSSFRLRFDIVTSTWYKV